MRNRGRVESVVVSRTSCRLSGNRFASVAPVSLLVAWCWFIPFVSAEDRAPTELDPGVDQSERSREHLLVGLPIAAQREVAASAECLTLPSPAFRRPMNLRTDQWNQWLPLDVQYTRGIRWLSLREDEPDRPMLRQRFVPSSRGSPLVLMGADVPESRRYRVSQSVLFERGFVWGGKQNQTGKFGFGLAGGTATSGGVVDSGGFTARWIWRGTGDGTARFAVYSYAADRPGDFGEDITVPRLDISTNEWIQLVMEVTTNTKPDRSDGSLRAWINGVQVLARHGIAWQTEGDNPQVQSLTYASFYGGNDESWAPPRDTFMRVADVCWVALPEN